MLGCLTGIAPQGKQRAEKPSRAGMHRARQAAGCAQPRTRGCPGLAQPPLPRQQPLRSIPGGGKQNLAAPQRSSRRVPASAENPARLASSPLAQPAPVHKSSSSCPFSWDQGLLPCTTAFPGDHGGRIQPPSWVAPAFPLCTLARHPIAPVLQANPRPPQPAFAQLHRRSEKGRCAFSSDSFSVFSFPFFFFFLKAQPQPCTQQKPSACSLPHPSTGPGNNLLPPPKSRQPRARCRLKKEAAKLLTVFINFRFAHRPGLSCITTSAQPHALPGTPRSRSKNHTRS